MISPGIVEAMPSATATTITTTPSAMAAAMTATVTPTTAMTIPTATATPLPAYTTMGMTGADPRFGAVEAGANDTVADQLGVRWTRIPFTWANMQPAGPTSWNTFYLGNKGNDAAIDTELEHGRSVVGILGGTPAWAAANPAVGATSPPVNLDLPWNDPRNYWGAYCYRLAHDFAGRVDDWIIYNEVSIPDGLSWTQWRGSMQDYADTLKIAYEAIHAANPNARVVLYGDPFWYDHGDYLSKLYPLLHQMDPTNQYNGFFDAANLHLYSNPVGMGAMVAWDRALLAEEGWGDKPIWVSETNAEPYDDPEHPQAHADFRVSLQAQASFMVEAFAELLAAGAARIEVYKMADGPDSDLGFVDQAGFVHPAGTTFALLSHLYAGVDGGTIYPGDEYGGKGGIFRVVLHAPGRRITVLWNQGGSDRTYQMDVTDPRAIVYTKYGQATPVAGAGMQTFTLPGNPDGFTNQFDNRIPVVGGDPVIVVEHVAS